MSGTICELIELTWAMNSLINSRIKRQIIKYIVVDKRILLALQWPEQY